MYTRFTVVEVSGQKYLTRLETHTNIATDFNMYTTASDLINSNCTSCEVTQDKSAYWTPALYFMYPDGTTELVPQVGGMLA